MSAVKDLCCVAGGLGGMLWKVVAVVVSAWQKCTLRRGQVGSAVRFVIAGVLSLGSSAQMSSSVTLEGAVASRKSPGISTVLRHGLRREKACVRRTSGCERCGQAP